MSQLKIDQLITSAQVRGATVHTTRHEDGTTAVVQVIGLPRMTTWPLPVRQAEIELTAAIK